jgi:hypothetical protein
MAGEPYVVETTEAFERAEGRVEKRSQVLRKELGLGTLVLTQILYVVRSSSISIA